MMTQNTKTKILGIDMSISCPSFTILDEDCNHIITYAFPQELAKKRIKIINSLDEGYKFRVDYLPTKEMEFRTEFERYNYVANCVYKRIKEYHFNHAFIEGYAMGAKGRVFDIAETTSALKKLLLDNDGLAVYPIAPTENKKMFSGKGNAGKDLMGEKFLDITGENIHITFDTTKGIEDKLVNDMVDSYSIAHSGIKLLNL